MPQLKDYLPDRMLSSPVRNFIEAFQPQIDAMADSFAGMADSELFAATADKWMGLWETAYGIVSEPEKSLAYRRSRLMSKVRGTGTTTAEQIKQVASSFANSECEVIEHPESYSFVVKFVGTVGIPPNMEDVKAAIDEIKPAHLAYQFLYLFYCWQDYDAQTWGSVSTKTWTEMKG